MPLYFPKGIFVVTNAGNISWGSMFSELFVYRSFLQIFSTKVQIIVPEQANTVFEKKFYLYIAYVKPETLIQVYQHPLFRPEDLELICAAHHLVEHQKGDSLLHEGRISDEYYIVEDGLVRTFVHDFDGNDITTGFVGNRQVLIEVASIFSRTPTRENIQCLTDVQLWKIDYQRFQELFHLIPGFREWGRAWMAMELYRNKTRATEMITLPATQRYLQLLNQTPQIIQQAPLKFIASYLGITDTSLSRIRKEIADGKSC